MSEGEVRRINLDPTGQGLPPDGIAYNSIPVTCPNICPIVRHIPEEWRLAALRHVALQTQVWCPRPNLSGEHVRCGMASEQAKQGLVEARIHLVPEAEEILQEGL